MGQFYALNVPCIERNISVSCNMEDNVSIRHTYPFVPLSI